MRASDHILNKDCYLGAIRVYQILFSPQSIFSLFDLEKKNHIFRFSDKGLA